jgi:hypothetical protein
MAVEAGVDVELLKCEIRKTYAAVSQEPDTDFPTQSGQVRRPRHDGQGIQGRKEDVMRAIDCPCGHHLEGADDEELFRLAREHVERDHPEMERTDDQIRERVAADAYDA